MGLPNDVYQINQIKARENVNDSYKQLKNIAYQICLEEPNNEWVLFKNLLGCNNIWKSQIIWIF